MSLVDDQIINDSQENALDDLSRRVNKAKDARLAAEAVLQFEEAIKMTQVQAEVKRERK